MGIEGAYRGLRQFSHPGRNDEGHRMGISQWRSALGHNNANNRMVPTCIAALHFDNASIMPVVGGSLHCALVTDRGGLYTWGKAPSLGRTGKKAQVLPTHIAPLLLQVSRARCYNHVLPTHAKGTHSRLRSRAAPTVAQETATVAAEDSNQRRSQRR